MEGTVKKAAKELEFANTYDEEHSRYMVKVRVFEDRHEYFGPTLGQAIANAKAEHEDGGEKSGLMTDSIMKGHGGYRVYQPDKDKKRWVRVKNEDPDAEGYVTIIHEALDDLERGNKEAAYDAILFVAHGLNGIDKSPEEWCERQVRKAAERKGEAS